MKEIKNVDFVLQVSNAEVDKQPVIHVSVNGNGTVFYKDGTQEDFDIGWDDTPYVDGTDNDDNILEFIEVKLNELIDDIASDINDISKPGSVGDE